MASVTSDVWQVVDVAPKIGTAIHTDKATLLGGERAGEIRDILERRGVVVFPKIDLSDEEQIAFTHTIGTFAHEASEQQGRDGDFIYPISMDAKVNPHADYLKAAFFWHLDGTMADSPIRASIMSARQLASEGGDTEFCNTYAAWEDLADEEKLRIVDLKVIHAFWRSQLYWRPEPSIEEFERWMAVGENKLPLVWNHRSGRKSLVLGATAQRVEGMGIVESESLLIRLRDWATRPQFVYRHKWSLGDMVIWDNTGTLHRALPYDHGSGRLMHRTKLEGEETFA